MKDLQNMNDGFNKEKIEAYLLGSLTDEEAERFDELSFTNEDFADALLAAEADLIDRYVNGELSGAPRERFESFYFAAPRRRKRVEFARQLQRFAESEIAAPKKNFAAEKEESKNNSSKFFASLNFFKNQNSFLQFGFAAAIVLILFLGGLLIFRNIFNQTDSQVAKVDSPANVENQTPPQAENTNAGNSINQAQNANSEQPNSANLNFNSAANQKEKTPIELAPTPKPKDTVQPSKPIVASFLLLPALRGGNRIESISIAEKITDAAVRLQLEADEFPAYRVNLVDQSNGRILWRSATIKAKSKGANKQLNVNFSAKLLKSQIYTLQVSGVSAEGKTEIIGDYPFRVVR